MTVPARVSFVTIGVRDLARMRAFYEDALGWTPRITVDDFAAYDVGGTILGLYETEKLAHESRSEQPASGTWSGWTLSSNAPTREGVDELWQRWVDAGATPIAEPVDHPYGPRSGYVADPEGNRWEIAWAPGIEVEE